MKPLLTVGLITDTHIYPDGGGQTSPYAVNNLANGRARFAVTALAALQPDFTVHLGDMVHTLPGLPTYADACREAHKIFTPLKPHIHYVAGNHDIGDKPVAHAPAEPTGEKSTALYEEQFGPCWYDFTNENCHFVTVNSSLCGTESKMSLRQQDWLEQTLQKHRARRTFLFSHYPPYIDSPDEAAHYDNWQPDARQWLLSLLKKHRVEAVFSGHVHQFFYNRAGNTKFYCLPATSFIRQDFSELYRGSPAPEFGRDDVDKYSIALLEIFPDGHHRIKVIPTFGRSLGNDEKPKSFALPQSLDSGVSTTLRHAWFESMHLPANGPMEEFTRKPARNDYILLRLLQMGIHNVRVPVADLIDSAPRQRCMDAAALGISFIPVLAEPPGKTVQTALQKSAGIIAKVEIVTPTVTEAHIGKLLDKMESSGMQKNLILSKAHSSANTPLRGEKFVHTVSTGFVAEDMDAIRDLMSAPSIANRLPAMMFQINLDDNLSETIESLANFATEVNLDIVINLRLAQRDPSKSNFDDAAILARIRQALELGGGQERLSLHLDDYMDIDRGYAPRNGLVDRLTNLRQAGLYFAGLSAHAADK